VAVRLSLPPGRKAVRATIVSDEHHTVLDEHGAVRSTQAADLILPREMLDELWSPLNLERLARTYWRFLSRVSLGAIRVVYTPSERVLVLLTRPLALLRFRAPEYELSADRGVVRWRIRSGLLVSRRGDREDGRLQIEVRREQGPGPAEVTIHVEVEVANFYPAIAHRLSAAAYRMTQSRVHVIVTHAFLRSLARLDLARSRVGRFERGDPPD